MKYSAAILSTLVAVVAAKPHILNTSFDVREGQPFELMFDGCDPSCTIEVQTGPSTGLKSVKTLDTTATGGSATVTVDGLTSGQYNFKITNNSDGESNYSIQFAFVGTATATMSTMDSTMSSGMTSTMDSTMSTDMSSTAASTMTTTMSSGMTTATATKTSSDGETSTSASASATNSVPADDNSAKRLSSPLALIACAVAAIAYMN